MVQISTSPFVTLRRIPLELQLLQSQLQFQLPSLDGYPISEIPAAAIADALSLHLRFRLDAEPYIYHKTLEAQTRVELKSVLGTFPTVHDPTVIAAMTAWFYLNCHVDDLVESIQPDAARGILGEVPVLLHGPSERSSDLLFSTPLLRSDSEHGSSDEDVLLQIRHAFRRTRQHLQALLPQAVYQDLCPDMIVVFEAMRDEITFRQLRSHDLARYLAIRARTIALGPFFKLVHFSTGSTSGMSQELVQLESSVSLAVGLQNDVLGLDKDVARGDWMNYPMVFAASYCGKGETSAIEAGAHKGVENHNLAVAVAIKQWSAIREKGLAEDKKVAATMLILITQHFKWASKASRYKN